MSQSDAQGRDEPRSAAALREEHRRRKPPGSESAASITEPLSQAELLDAICDILDICEGWTRTMTDKQCLAAIKSVASKAFEGDRG